MANWLREKKDPEFDSRIDTPSDSDDFMFTLILRVFLRPVNPPNGKSTSKAVDADNISVPIMRWTRAAWVHFRTEFRLQAYMTWDRAFRLSPPANYDGFLWPEGRGTRRNVMCAVEVDVFDRADNTHATIDVVQLKNPGPHKFRSDDFDLDSGDLLPTQLRAPGVTWEQHPIPHEVGHLLGLGHVAQGTPECRQDFSKCYGRSLQESFNVMGRGDTLDLADAKPWLERIARVHTKTDPKDWSVDWATDETPLRGTENIRSVAAK